MRRSTASGTGVLAALAILVPTLDAQTAPGPPVQEGYLKGADGVRLYYRVVGDTGQPLIVLHGTPAHMQAMEPYFAPLARSRTLIFYDQRGGGRSQVVTDPDRLTWRDHVRDLEAVRRHFGLERVSLLGKSWGSGLAALYASEHPDRVDRLVLLTMRARHDAPTPPELRPPEPDTAVARRLADMRAAWDDVEEIVAHCRMYWDLLTRGSAGYRAVWEDMCEEPPEAVRNHNRIMEALGASLGRFDWRPLLEEIRAPALIVKGAEAALPTHRAREWLQALPDARLLLIPGSSGVEWVENPDAFFRAVDAFLNGAWPREAEPAEAPPASDVDIDAVDG